MPAEQIEVQLQRLLMLYAEGQIKTLVLAYEVTDAEPNHVFTFSAGQELNQIAASALLHQTCLEGVAIIPREEDC